MKLNDMENIHRLGSEKVIKINDGILVVKNGNFELRYVDLYVIMIMNMM
jgi:hypothetical protein